MGGTTALGRMGDAREGRARATDPVARARRLVRRIGPWRVARLVLFLLLALLAARLGWSTPLLVDAERALYDVRTLATAPAVEQDGRIALVAFTDETLAATGKRSPLDRALLARALRNLDAMGARAIGIDILLDQAQPEDAELVAAFRAMRTPVRLAWAEAGTNADSVRPWQEAFLRAFHQRLRPGAVAPASIRLETDPDNVMRSWPPRPPGLPPLLADALAPGTRFADHTGSLLYRAPAAADRPVFLSLPIDLFGDPGTAPLLADQIRGRYVLIGGDLSDVDRFDTPATRLSGATTVGLEVHAHMLAQLLDDRRPLAMPGWFWWLAAALVVATGALVAAQDLSPTRMATAFVQSAALLVLVPFALQWQGVDTQGLPMFGWIVGWLLAFVAVGSAARAVGSRERRFAQGALGRYLPPDVARSIIADPDRLALHGEKREIFALFTDLEGFTQLSHRIPPETVAMLLNRYLDLLSDVVLEHGGTLDKFVGDAVIAFWGAPIAHADDGDRAVRAALAMADAGERFRREAPPGVPPIGRTRVGLHRGEAVVGNFGGDGRIQYTALGDSMNAASRLECANKTLGTTVLVSAEAVAGSTLDLFRPMGRVTLRGRSDPIEVWEPAPDLDAGIRARMRRAWTAFDGGDARAMDDLRALSAERPDDAALANLICRLDVVGPGGSYVLD